MRVCSQPRTGFARARRSHQQKKLRVLTPLVRVPPPLSRFKTQGVHEHQTSLDVTKVTFQIEGHLSVQGHTARVAARAPHGRRGRVLLVLCLPRMPTSCRTCFNQRSKTFKTFACEKYCSCCCRLVEQVSVSYASREKNVTSSMLYVCI